MITPTRNALLASATAVVLLAISPLAQDFASSHGADFFLSAAYARGGGSGGGNSGHGGSGNSGGGSHDSGGGDSGSSSGSSNGGGDDHGNSSSGHAEAGDDHGGGRAGRGAGDDDGNDDHGHHAGAAADDHHRRGPRAGEDRADRPQVTVSVSGQALQGLLNGSLVAVDQLGRPLEIEVEREHGAVTVTAKPHRGDAQRNPGPISSVSIVPPR